MVDSHCGQFSCVSRHSSCQLFLDTVFSITFLNAAVLRESPCLKIEAFAAANLLVPLNRHFVALLRAVAENEVTQTARQTYLTLATHAPNAQCPNKAHGLARAQLLKAEQMSVLTVLICLIG